MTSSANPCKEEHNSINYPTQIQVQVHWYKLSSTDCFHWRQIRLRPTDWHELGYCSYRYVNWFFVFEITRDSAYCTYCTYCTYYTVRVYETSWHFGGSRWKPENVLKENLFEFVNLKFYRWRWCTKNFQAKRTNLEFDVVFCFGWIFIKTIWFYYK